MCNAETFSTQGFHFNVLAYGVELVSNVDENGVKVVPDYSGDIIIPDKVSYDGQDYFVTQIASDAFEYSHDVTSVIMPKFLKIIKERAFRDCNKISRLVFNEGLVTIGADNFNGCPLTELILPSTVTKIGQYCFNSLPITSLNLPDNLQRIEVQCFSYCDNLKSVNIGKSLTVISPYFLLGCINLTEINISDKNERFKVENNSIIDMALQSLVRVPGGFIGKYIVPDVLKIETSAIGHCPYISEIIFNENLEEIDYVGCAWNDNVISVIIPDKVKTIGYESFAYNNKLETVTIGKSVNLVDIDAFSHCPMLKTITCLPQFPPETPGNITDEINYLYTNLRVPQSAKGAYFLQKYDWRKFVNSVIFDENSGIESVLQSNKTIIGRYNLDGIPVDESYKGVVILQLSDGSIVKKLSE